MKDGLDIVTASLPYVAGVAAAAAVGAGPVIGGVLLAAAAGCIAAICVSKKRSTVLAHRW